MVSQVALATMQPMKQSSFNYKEVALMATRIKKARSVSQSFQRLRKQLNATLLERSSEIDAVLVALLAKEHVLLLGPPGTAKSLLVEKVSKALGSSYFYWLMNRFTLPEDILGPLSIQALKQDQYVRKTDGMLPEAEVVFLDEVFKANSSIQNALLTVLNERKFHNGGKAVACPLQTCIGASNELPESNELDALYDRFALRLWTEPVSATAVRELLKGSRPAVTQTITAKELEAGQAAVEQVVIPDSILDTLILIKIEAEKEGFVSTDRRWVEKVPNILRATAWLDRCKEVTEDHVLMLEHVLWDKPESKSKLAAIISRIANPVANTVTEIMDMCKERYNQIPFNTKVAEDETSSVFNQIVDCNAMLKNCVQRLEKLQNGKRHKRVDDAISTLTDWSQEASRYAGKISGLTL